jgi:hypothetical protein
VPGEATVTTRAVSIDAPAEEVWRWLVQIGCSSASNSARKPQQEAMSRSEGEIVVSHPAGVTGGQRLPAAPQGHLGGRGGKSGHVGGTFGPRARGVR